VTQCALTADAAGLEDAAWRRAWLVIGFAVDGQREIPKTKHHDIFTLCTHRQLVTLPANCKHTLRAVVACGARLSSSTDP